MIDNQIHEGDNLEILGRHFPDDSVDLIYLDPPFNSNADYQVAEGQAFTDTWRWDPQSVKIYQRLITSEQLPDRTRHALIAFHDLLGPSDTLAYLVMMAPRLVELHRVLKPSGSLYLHCDPSASHALKLLLDAIFGPEHFQNEVIWKRTHAHGSAKRFGPVHDVILLYSKTSDFYWNTPRIKHSADYVDKHFKRLDPNTGRKYQAITLTGSGVRFGESGKPWRGIDPTSVGRHWAIPGKVIERLKIEGKSLHEKLDALDALGRIDWPAKKSGTPRLKWFADELEGVSLSDVWGDIAPLSAKAVERTGYPTQKPLVLLERIITSSSREGDLVLDPFCGCGTTLAAAQKLGRRWIGIDVAPLAIAMTRRRLGLEMVRAADPT